MVGMTNTHLAAVIDRSGSMDFIKDDMEGGFSSFLEEQKSVPGNLTVSLYQFDNLYETVYENQNVKNVGRYHLVPRGSTALYDAIGRTINRVKSQVNSSLVKPDHVVIYIVTDGFENASREFNVYTIKALIAEVQELGWKVVFLGANQDAVLTAATLGIARMDSMTYSATSSGVKGMAAASSTYLGNLRTTNNAAFTETDRIASK